ncbi:hypothetical protein [Pelagibacterium sp. H642]|uniref:hypothetical protein n=1 Tax=Pelagibacterium sp. H642 TaxID=1881069 RepID=UPI00281647A1|nr:hypothetical protein [Pelagibacterium sp. H642]WMT92814.1 hypothetical protein NO934_18710 [Pelagibacterium sp. H642]
MDTQDDELANVTLILEVEYENMDLLHAGLDGLRDAGNLYGEVVRCEAINVPHTITFLNHS